MLRKRHKLPKKLAIPQKSLNQTQQSGVNTNTLPVQAEHLLADPQHMRDLETVLNQINAYYDLAWNGGKEVLPIFVGLTPLGLLVELSAVRDKARVGEPVDAADLNVFTYRLGSEPPADVQPREIAEVNMIKGQEQIRLKGDARAAMPDPNDSKAMAHWRFIEAETIQLHTLGIFELQPENYDQISFGHGIKNLGGSEDAIIPLQHFAAEIK